MTSLFTPCPQRASQPENRAWPLFLAVLLAGLLIWLGPYCAAGAAAFAEDHTVLYYLIEMQRRTKRSCDGTPMPEAPSLMPSEALRALAESAVPGQPSPAADALRGIPHWSATVPGQNPQQALEALLASDCSSLMQPAFRYIGASSSNGRWTLLMAGAEPGSSGTPGPHAPGPGHTEFDQPGPDAGAPSLEPRQPARSAETGPTVPSAGVSPQAAPSPPSAEPRSAASPGAATPPPPLPPDLDKPWPANRLGEAAPATPYVVGEMDLDAAGKPVGRVRQVAPPALAPTGSNIARPEDISSYHRDAGPEWNQDYVVPPERQSEAAPASPVVTGEKPLDAAGRPVDSSAPGLDYLPRPPVTRGSAAPPVTRGQSGGPVVVRDPGPGRTVPAQTAPAQSAPRRTGSTVGTPGGTPGGAPVGAPGAAGTRPGVTPLEDTRPPVAQEGITLAPRQDGISLDPRQDGTPLAPAPALRPVTTPLGAPAARPEGAPGSTQDMLGLINDVRSSGAVCGGNRIPPARPLRESAMLSATARAHAADMAASGYFSSTSPEGMTLGRRVAAGGYVWSFVAENLSSGRATAGEAFDRWLADEQQCLNLLSPDYQDIGLAFEPVGRLWVATLAAPLEEGTPRTR